MHLLTAKPALEFSGGLRYLGWVLSSQTYSFSHWEYDCCVVLQRHVGYKLNKPRTDYGFPSMKAKGLDAKLQPLYFKAVADTLSWSSSNLSSCFCWLRWLIPLLAPTELLGWLTYQKLLWRQCFGPFISGSENLTSLSATANLVSLPGNKRKLFPWKPEEHREKPLIHMKVRLETRKSQEFSGKIKMVKNSGPQTWRQIRIIGGACKTCRCPSSSLDW